MDRYKEWICGIDTNNQTIYTKPCKNSFHRGETLYQEFALLDEDYKDISIIYSQAGQIRVIKLLSDLTIENNKIHFYLSSDDTLSFTANIPLICQVEIKKNDDSIIKSRQLLSYVLESPTLKTCIYKVYAYAMNNIVSVVQTSSIKRYSDCDMLLTLNESWSDIDDFDVIFKDEYNHEVAAYKAKLVPNRYYVKIPDTVLDLPGKLYMYIKSSTLATGLSNALRVDICYKEETLTDGDNNN